MAAAVTMAAGNPAGHGFADDFDRRDAARCGAAVAVGCLVITRTPGPSSDLDIEPALAR